MDHTYIELKSCKNIEIAQFDTHLGVIHSPLDLPSSTD